MNSQKAQASNVSGNEPNLSREAAEPASKDATPPAPPSPDERSAALVRLKLGRNDPCPCGSGKKYKKCCLPKDEVLARRPVQSESQPPSASPTEINRPPAEESDARRTEPGGLSLFHEHAADSESPGFEGDDEEDYQHPELSEAENRIANEWWSQVSEHYLDKPDGGEVLRRLHAFLDEHPRIFRHLGTEEEMLHERKPMLHKQGRMHDYPELLRRLRREQPETYRECFGWFDLDLIADAAARGAWAEIPPCFSYFRDKGDDDHGHLSRLCSLLAWVGRPAELFDLAEGTLNMDPESEDWATSDSAKWLCLREAMPFLDARASSPEDVKRMLTAQRKVLGLGTHIKDDLERACYQLESAAVDAESWKMPSVPGPGGKGYTGVMWNYAGWLVRRRHRHWVTATLMSSLAWGHWIWRSHQPRAKDPFRMNAESLTDYLDWADGDDQWIGGIEPFAFIQSIAWFGDYLIDRKTWSEPNATELRGVCAELYAAAAMRHASENLTLRLCPTFDMLVAGLSVMGTEVRPS